MVEICQLSVLSGIDLEDARSAARPEPGPPRFACSAGGGRISWRHGATHVSEAGTSSSSRTRSTARRSTSALDPALPAAVEQPGAVGGPLRARRGGLRLLIEADQEPWCPEFDGEVRVSSLQTGVFAGPVGSGRPAPLQPRCGRARGAGERPALHAAVRPRRDARRASRRPAQHGRALDDRLRGRARALGGDLRLRDLRRDVAAGQRRGRHGRAPVRRSADRRRVRGRDVADRRPRVPRLRGGVDPERVEFSVDGEPSRPSSSRRPIRCSSCSASTSSPTRPARPARSLPKEFVVDYVRGYRRIPG